MWFCVNPQLEETVCRLLRPVVSVLEQPLVQEVSVNWLEGKALVFADYGAGDMTPIEAVLWPSAVETATLIIASDRGKHIDPLAPFLNCVLPCGFRFNAALPPVSDGPRFSIRTHNRHDWMLRDYAREEDAALIVSAIRHYQNILIAGATSSGKTSLLSAMINLIPPSERLLVIEDEQELVVRAGNVVRSKATKHGDLKRHIHEGMRQRPDRIIVGEVRGPEAYDMLDSFVTGHPGGMCTIHAKNCHSALLRLQRLAGCDWALVEDAIDLVLYIERMDDGSRQVLQTYELK